MSATVIYLWAPWCMECRAMGPHLDEIAGEFADTLQVEKINVAESPAVAARLEVMATPTIIARRDERELFRVSGRRTPTELRELFGAAAAGSSAVDVGGADRALRIGSGAALIAAGAVLGPAWPLIGAGIGIAAWGALGSQR